MNLVHERMSPIFEKWHLEGLPFGASLHRFTAPDEGDPHDHPWDFTSHILKGSYVERVFRMDGTFTDLWRMEGSSHKVGASHIHRIIELPDGECWTLCLAGSPKQTPGFYRFQGNTVLHRFWNEPDFKELMYW